MNQLNETIRSIRSTIEIERKQEQPDIEKINELEKELELCLKKII